MTTCECLFDPEIYFVRDTDSEGDSEDGKSDHDDGHASKCSGSQHSSSSNWQESDSEEEEDSAGYEFEIHHFQLAAFRTVLGRVPHDVFEAWEILQFIF